VAVCGRLEGDHVLHGGQGFFDLIPPCIEPCEGHAEEDGVGVLGYPLEKDVLRRLTSSLPRLSKRKEVIDICPGRAPGKKPFKQGCGRA
jgi:hypothetical protein